MPAPRTWFNGSKNSTLRFRLPPLTRLRRHGRNLASMTATTHERPANVQPSTSDQDVVRFPTPRPGDATDTLDVYADQIVGWER